MNAPLTPEQQRAVGKGIVADALGMPTPPVPNRGFSVPHPAAGPTAAAGRLWAMVGRVDCPHRRRG